MIQILVMAALFATEAEYVKEFCEGQIEHRLWDATRVDCLLDDEAQEYDYGRKWAEAIGQSLWYAMNTGTRAAIVLIIETESDKRGLRRARAEIAHYNLPITVHVIEATK